MISNERQYRITKAEAERFRRTLAELETDGRDQEGVHPRLVQAQREALQSQLDDLLHEIREYEELRAGKVPLLSIDSFEDLPDGLIKARIAAGLSQKALAGRLHLKEQQIQRYESERYASASLQRIQEVARAIGVQIREEILLPLVPTNFDTLTSKLRQVGVERDFLMTRLLPSADAAQADGSTGPADEAMLVTKTASILSRVFGWSADELFQP